MEQKSRIYIAGHEKSPGIAVTKKLQDAGYSNIMTRSPEELNLMDTEAVTGFFGTERPEYVFLFAAKSGSIQANQDHPAEFIHTNLIMETNLIHAAFHSGVKKLLFQASSCVYPGDSPQPIQESSLLQGKLEPTSEAYSIARIAGIEMCRAYTKQYGVRFFSTIPATLYGPYGDLFGRNSHVLSSLIQKIHTAKKNNDKEVILWGTGTPRREFIHTDDAADASIFLMRQAHSCDMVNIGTGKDYSIRELAEIVKGIVGYSGEIRFDSSKSDGTPRKILNSGRIKQLGWKPSIPFDKGLEDTVRWYNERFSKTVEA